MPQYLCQIVQAWTKSRGLRDLSDVILKGSNYDEAYQFAMEYATENNLEFVHPFQMRR